MSKAWRFMTKAAEAKMIKNHERAERDGGGSMDDKPVIKLFNPVGNAYWFLSEYDPETRCFFGLCDLGMGYPEMGYVSRDELEGLRLVAGLRIERDMYWTPSESFNELMAKRKAA